METRNPFEKSIAKLAEIQQEVLGAIQADQGLFNMGRQAMDNLNVTYLLVANLGQYIVQKDEMVDKEVAEGNITTFPGAGESDADA